MNEENITVEEQSLDMDAAFLPDGWDGEGDIFEDSTWDSPADASAEAPTIEQTETVDGGEDSDDAAPTTEPEEEVPAEPQSRTIKIPGVKFNHETFDADVDENELPSIYQKSLAFDGVNERLSKANDFIARAEQRAREMGFKDANDMLESAGENYRALEIERLKDKGWSDEEAEEQYEMLAHYRRSRASSQEPAEAPAEAPAEQAKPSVRDLANELMQLKQLRPNFDINKPLPNDVAKAVTEQGMPLVTAYLLHEAKAAEARTAAIEKENKTLKQNAAAAARAPVSGVSGGGKTDTTPSDDFLKGFDRAFRI